MKTNHRGRPYKGRSLFDDISAEAPTGSPTTGEERKRAAHALLELHRPRIIRAGRRALLVHLLEHGRGTMDDVRRSVLLPVGMDARVFGVIGSLLVASGIIRFAGYSKTTRPEAHSHPVSVWTLADRDKALAWLAANPELPVPAEGGE